MTETEQAFDELLEHLRETRGFDFSAYKREGLQRRVRKRMQTRGIDDFAAYHDLLEVEPEEYERLFNAILINLTRFFRDPELWDEIRDQVLPDVIAANEPDLPIRAWTAGCSSGEEAYTLAMLLAEDLGEEAFVDRVKIYATDVDEEALDSARAATYSTEALEPVPSALRERYFVPGPRAGELQFRPELRRSVIFGRHDLLNDAPISHVDLLACRNTLMYLNADVQHEILARFHFALKPAGYLFVGRAEMLLTHATLFHPVRSKGRIFQKTSEPAPRPPAFRARRGAEDDDGEMVVRELAADLSPVAQIVVDAERKLLEVNESARQAFGLTRRDIGRPFQDLDLSYRPVELRSVLEDAFAEGRSTRVPEVRRDQPNGDTTYFVVEATPLLGPDGPPVGATITFQDVTPFRRLQDDLERSNHELETAYEELQSSNEELETTNEELQSTVEELETTNEELQSSNEELETTNEELQSTNEELHGINEQLRQRTEELDRSKAFLESVLENLRVAVVVCDEKLRILVWNNRAEELWGLRADEAEGSSILSLDIGLEIDDELRGWMETCLRETRTSDELVRKATDRRGKSVTVRITCTTLRGPERSREGVVVAMDEDGGAWTRDA